MEKTSKEQVERKAGKKNIERRVQERDSRMEKTNKKQVERQAEKDLIEEQMRKTTGCRRLARNKMKNKQKKN